MQSILDRLVLKISKCSCWCYLHFEEKAGVLLIERENKLHFRKDIFVANLSIFYSIHSWIV